MLEDIRRRHLGKLGPSFYHLLVLGLFVEMFSIGFGVIVFILRGLVVRIVVVMMIHVKGDTAVTEGASGVELCRCRSTSPLHSHLLYLHFILG